MNTLSWIADLSLIVAAASFLVILTDIIRHPRHMWIMNIVWPVTGLYFGPAAVIFYFAAGRRTGKEGRPFWQSSAIGAMHCGAGCTLGDIVAEWFVFFVPLRLFGMTLFWGWLVDYVLAFSFGIAFQYFTIKPMRKLSVSGGIKAALKADTLSLTSWQVGMYGWMAIATFVIFGRELEQTDTVFWFMMQIAMIAGFFTAYPVNRWLLRKGVKEAM